MDVPIALAVRALALSMPFSESKALMLVYSFANRSVASTDNTGFIIFMTLMNFAVKLGVRIGTREFCI